MENTGEWGGRSLFWDEGGCYADLRVHLSRL